jgi:FAD/FMN-containing dehydrogenase
MTKLPQPPKAFRGLWLTDPAARAAYSEGAGPYRIIPSAVAVPSDRDDLPRLLEHVRQQGFALVPRAAGSGMPGGNVGSGIMLDLQQLDRPLAVSERGVATAGAAVTWQSLDEAAATQGMRLPPDPSSGAFCTVGGMVATNAAGARSVCYGSIRRWVRGLELVTTDGECTWLARGAPDSPVAAAGRTPEFGAVPAWVERFESDAAGPIRNAADLIRRRFPRTRKNSAGYALDAYLDTGDLLDLVIGSEGTLGVITRVELELDVRPGGVAGLLLGIADLEQLGSLVERLLPLEPAALELLDRTYLDIAGEQTRVPHDAAAVLLVDFESVDAHAVRGTVEEAAAAARNLTSFAESALDPEEHARLWELRHAASPALAALPDTRRSLQVIEDGCVPLPALGEYLAGVRAAAKELDIQVVAFGHAGDGHLHVNALVDTTAPDFETRLAALFDRVTDLVVTLGGTPSGEHGDGRLRAGTLERVYGAEILELFHRVKRAFDPLGVMNPGVIIPEPGAGPLDDLKVGGDAVTIPEALAQELRDIERTGGWGVSRLELPDGGESS